MSTELDEVEGDTRAVRVLLAAAVFVGEASCDAGDKDELDPNSSSFRFVIAALSVLRFRASTGSSS